VFDNRFLMLINEAIALAINNTRDTPKPISKFLLNGLID
jgi:hypothetical protein